MDTQEVIAYLVESAEDTKTMRPGRKRSAEEGIIFDRLKKALAPYKMFSMYYDKVWAKGTFVVRGPKVVKSILKIVMPKMKLKMTNFQKGNKDNLFLVSFKQI